MEELERKRELRRAKEDAVHAIEEEEIEKRRIRKRKGEGAQETQERADGSCSCRHPAVPADLPRRCRLLRRSQRDSSKSLRLLSRQRSNRSGSDSLRDRVCQPQAQGHVKPPRPSPLRQFRPRDMVGKQGKADVVCGIEGIDKARFSLKCQICPTLLWQKLYPKIQCTRGKCPRSRTSAVLSSRSTAVRRCLPGETADRLEGKKAPTSAQQSDGLEDGVESAWSCSARPTTRFSVRPRKRAKPKSCANVSMLCRSRPWSESGPLAACFQALMVEIREDEDEIVIEDEGRPSTVKFPARSSLTKSRRSLKQSRFRQLLL